MAKALNQSDAGGEASALLIAALIFAEPARVHDLRRTPLPDGMTLLLGVVARDAASLDRAARLTQGSPELLIKAAAFYVEQILFFDRSDSYRVLGGTSTTSTERLRQHMALLMRWLHPDMGIRQQQGFLDRRVFATTVTTAWQALKSEQRRASYRVAHTVADASSHTNARRSGMAVKRRRYSRFGLLHLGDDSLFARIFLFFRRGR